MNADEFERLKNQESRGWVGCIVQVGFGLVEGFVILIQKTEVYFERAIRSHS